MEGACSELDKLIHNCEFENQQYVRLIQHEKGLIERYDREGVSCREEQQRLTVSLGQYENDIDQCNRQVDINKTNNESLKSTSHVLTEHLSAMSTKLNMVKAQRQKKRLEHERYVQHQRAVWDRYKQLYDTFPHAAEYKTVCQRHENLENRVKEKKLMIANLKQNLESQGHSEVSMLDTKTFIIKLAENRVKKMYIKKEMQQRLERIQNESQGNINSPTEKHSPMLTAVAVRDDAGHEAMDAERDLGMSSPMISVYSEKEEGDAMQTEDQQPVTRSAGTAPVEEAPVPDWLQYTQRAPQKAGVRGVEQEGSEPDCSSEEAISSSVRGMHLSENQSRPMQLSPHNQQALQSVYYQKENDIVQIRHGGSPMNQSPVKSPVNQDLNQNCPAPTPVKMAISPVKSCAPPNIGLSLPNQTSQHYAQNSTTLSIPRLQHHDFGARHVTSLSSIKQLPFSRQTPAIHIPTSPSICSPRLYQPNVNKVQSAQINPTGPYQTNQNMPAAVQQSHHQQHQQQQFWQQQQQQVHTSEQVHSQHLPTTSQQHHQQQQQRRAFPTVGAVRPPVVNRPRVAPVSRFAIPRSPVIQPPPRPRVVASAQPQEPQCQGGQAISQMQQKSLKINQASFTKPAVPSSRIPRLHLEPRSPGQPTSHRPVTPLINIPRSPCVPSEYTQPALVPQPSPVQMKSVPVDKQSPKKMEILQMNEITITPSDASGSEQVKASEQELSLSKEQPSNDESSSVKSPEPSPSHEPVDEAGDDSDIYYVPLNDEIAMSQQTGDGQEDSLPCTPARKPIKKGMSPFDLEKHKKFLADLKKSPENKALISGRRMFAQQAAASAGTGIVLFGGDGDMGMMQSQVSPAQQKQANEGGDNDRVTNEEAESAFNFLANFGAPRHSGLTSNKGDNSDGFLNLFGSASPSKKEPTAGDSAGFFTMFGAPEPANDERNTDSSIFSMFGNDEGKGGKNGNSDNGGSMFSFNLGESSVSNEGNGKGGDTGLFSLFGGGDEARIGEDGDNTGAGSMFGFSFGGGKDEGEASQDAGETGFKLNFGAASSDASPAHKLSLF